MCLWTFQSRTTPLQMNQTFLLLQLQILSLQELSRRCCKDCLFPLQVIDFFISSNWEQMLMWFRTSRDFRWLNCNVLLFNGSTWMHLMSFSTNIKERTAQFLIFMFMFDFSPFLHECDVKLNKTKPTKRMRQKLSLVHLKVDVSSVTCKHWCYPLSESPLVSQTLPWGFPGPPPIHTCSWWLVEQQLFFWAL